MKKIKRILTVSMGAVLGLVGSLTIGSVPGHAATTPSSCTAVFVSPHADDEVLSMGTAIRQHVVARGASKVCVVLFTTGGNTNTKPIYAPGSGIKLPGSASIYTNSALTTPAGMSRARDDEFRRSLRELGVLPKNIFIDNLPAVNASDWSFTGQMYKRPLDVNSFGTDGVPTNQENAYALMRAVFRNFPNADVKTQSDKDLSADHAALGRALRHYSSQVSSARFYVPPYQKGNTRVTVGKVVATSAEFEYVKRAAEQYGKLPAIGWTSVSAPFGGQALKVLRCGAYIGKPGTTVCNKGTAPLTGKDNTTLFEGGGLLWQHA